MNREFRELRKRQLNRQLGAIGEHALVVPKGGWLRSIREALGMSVVQFSKKLSMSREGARQIELAEADESITLKRLRRAANALDCDLAYVLIPRKPFEASPSEFSSTELRARVAHSMMLEGQPVEVDCLG